MRGQRITTVSAVPRERETSGSSAVCPLVAPAEVVVLPADVPEVVVRVAQPKVLLAQKLSPRKMMLWMRILKK